MGEVNEEDFAKLRATVKAACARAPRYDYPRTTTDTGTGYVMVDAYLLLELLQRVEEA